MKGRESKAGLPPADLLVCFPTRTHLSLMPKPICSPARGSDPTKRRHKHRMVKKAASRGSHGSPLLWARTKSMESEISEPTSPKVTCVGQIKVRPKTAASCKSWQSVMEEIERIHNDGKNRKRLGWVDVIGFKKDIMQFLTCLRSIKFDFRCFRAFPESDITTDDEDEEEEEEEEEEEDEEEEETTATTTNGKEKSNDVFSKWFMVLQEDQKNEFSEAITKENSGSFDDGSEIKAPPANALLLMRCRSAPAKSWQEEEEEKEEEDEQEEEEKEKDERKSKSLRTLIEEDNKTIKKKKLVITNYDSDSYKISSDVVKETWLVGGLTGDSLSRSRSWKRW